MGRDALAISCACGTFRARLVDLDRRAGTHICCHCRDCRAHYTALGRADPGAAGVSLFQTTPEHLRPEQGGAALEALRLTPGGVLRWSAKCCDTPLFNTLTTRRFPLVAVQSNRVLGDLGPVVARAFVPVKAPKAGSGKSAWKHERGGAMMGAVMVRALRSLASEGWRETMFFDPAGKPVAPIRLLSPAERAAAREALTRD